MGLVFIKIEQENKKRKELKESLKLWFKNISIKRNEWKYCLYASFGYIKTIRNLKFK